MRQPSKIRIKKKNQRLPSAGRIIARYYAALQQAYGRQHWWPGRSRFEVILGAFLTQNTAWKNVELALRNLRRARGLSVKAIRHMPEKQLAALIRPSGYFRQKAKRIKDCVRYLDAEWGGSLRGLLGSSRDATLEESRERLLHLQGVGRETADSILLYAGNHPIFVVDAYTRRILTRHGLIFANADYDDVRLLVEEALSARPLALAEEKNLGHMPSPMSRNQRSELAQHYNELHGLFVQVGKKHCHKAQPDCDGCPLQRFLPKNQTSAKH